MSIWDTVAAPIIAIINKVVPDKAAAAAAVASLQTMQVQGQLADEMAQLTAVTSAQSDINKIEAAQPGIHFRDGAGWICVAGFGVALLKAPIEWGTTLAGHPITLPAVDTTMIMPMLFALLGLGGLHSFDKVKGVA